MDVQEEDLGPALVELTNHDEEALAEGAALGIEVPSVIYDGEEPAPEGGAEGGEVAPAPEGASQDPPPAPEGVAGSSEVAPAAAQETGDASSV